MFEIHETFWWLLALLLGAIVLFWVTASARRWRLSRREEREKEVERDISGD
jgi:hypothetical protein